MKLTEWNAQDTYTEARQYRCGYCGLNVGALTGYGQKVLRIPNSNIQGHNLIMWVALCPNCAKPTFWDGGRQVPGATFGEDVKHLPSDIDGLYREARNCMAVNAFTAGAMACRKILMNVAVNRGAAENLSFVKYVNYLADEGYVPPNGKKWVDHIRDKGNEAVHEIPSLTQADLTDLIVFTEMLLKFIFEFPARVPS